MAMLVDSKLFSKPKFQICMIGILALFLLVPKIGDGILADYDDCYYAQKAKEILKSGDWITMQYSGRPRFDNPPLFLWLIALSFKLFGISKYSAVLVSALAGVLSILLTYSIARALFAPHVAYLSSFMLLTTPYFTKHARRAMMDVPLAFFYLVAFWSFIKGIEQYEGKKRPTWFLVTGLGVGCAILIKSVLGVLPLLVMCFYLLVSRKGSLLLHPLSFAGIGVALLTALPWFISQYLVHGRVFLEWHFGNLLWKRAVTGRYGTAGWHDHLGYVLDLSKEGWPWVPFFFAGILYMLFFLWRRKVPAGVSGVVSGQTPLEQHRHRPLRSGTHGPLFITAWVVGVLAVVSLAQERMLRYIIPVFPGMAIAAASLFGCYFASESRRYRMVLCTMLVLCLAAAAIVLTPIKLSKERKRDIYRLALVAAEVVPEGNVVVNLNQYYWSLSNVFLFYSDRDVTAPVKDHSLFKNEISRERFGILTRGEFDSLFETGSDQVEIVAGSGEWLLIVGGGKNVHAVIGGGP